MEEGETRGRAGTGRSGGASAGHTHVMKGSQAQQLYCIFISRFIPWNKNCKGALEVCRGATKNITSERSGRKCDK